MALAVILGIWVDVTCGVVPVIEYFRSKFLGVTSSDVPIFIMSERSDCREQCRVNDGKYDLNLCVFFFFNELIQLKINIHTEKNVRFTFVFAAILYYYSCSPCSHLWPSENQDDRCVNDPNRN